MASTATPRKKAAKKPASPPAPKPTAAAKAAGENQSLRLKKNYRLAFGSLFLIAGLFLCFAIISYFFTWKIDQDLFFGGSNASYLLLHDIRPVANWGGRLGAWASHSLVYNGVGVAALSFSLWLGVLGTHIIYGRRAAPMLRYLRWLCVVLLILAPIMAFLFPTATFSYGGAWGNEAVAYLTGLIGKGGTGLLLLGIAAFFLFGILALDISPMFRRARRGARHLKDGFDAARAAAAAAGTVAEFSKEDDDTEKEADEMADDSPEKEKPLPEMPTADNSVNVAPRAAALAPPPRVYEMEMTERPSGNGTTVNEKFAFGQAFTGNPEQPALDPDEAAYQKWKEQEEQAAATTAKQADPKPEPTPTPKPEAKQTQKPAAAGDDLNFEIVHQHDEAPAAAVAHGAHISIEENEPYAPELDLPGYKFPTVDLLENRSNDGIALDNEELKRNKEQIVNTLRSFGIEISDIKATVGPTVTLYEIVPAEGVRISKIRNLEDDIALNLAALGIRIIAPIPGRGTIGIEVPNVNKQIVSMRALISSEKFVNSKMSLPIALGKKIDNENYIVDLATMPHLLMAGATGQGKSVGINAILVSLLYKKHPSQLKFVLVDPKKVELSIYKAIEKHFLAKLPNEENAIITDTKKVINTLNALCIEMDNRYILLEDGGTRNIKEYNEKFIARRLNPEKGHKFLPFIVLVVDEFADLIMTAGKEVEMPIARLAQLARAVGIHIIIATQRPSVNVITGTIKANFPGRVAFKVSAKVDSRTILDTSGADQLVGRGDMLVSHGSELLRLQCAFVDTPEVEAVVNFIAEQRGYPTAFELPEYESDEETSAAKNTDLTNRDKMFEECARLVVSTQQGSTSNLQRKLNLGYNRAGRIMDQLEAASIVGSAVGSKPRDVLVQTEYELEQILDNLF